MHKTFPEQSCAVGSVVIGMCDSWKWLGLGLGVGLGLEHLWFTVKHIHMPPCASSPASHVPSSSLSQHLYTEVYMYFCSPITCYFRLVTAGEFIFHSVIQYT